MIRTNTLIALAEALQEWSEAFRKQYQETMVTLKELQEGFAAISVEIPVKDD